MLSNNPSLSLESSLFYFRFGIFSLAVWYLLTVNKKLINHFYKSLLVTFIFLIFDSYFQMMFGKNILGIEIPVDKDGQFLRVTGMFGDEQILGSYLSKMFPLLLGLFFLNLDNKKKLYFLPLFILISVMVFLSGSRSSLIYHILSIIFIFFLIDQWKKIFLSSTLISLIVVVIVGLNNEDLKNRLKDSLSDTGLVIPGSFDINYQNENMNQYSKPPYVKNHDFGFGKNKKFYLISPAYHSHFKTAYLMFRDNPLFGKGTKMFRYECSDGKFKNFTDFHIHDDEIYASGCSTHPHNTHVQFLAETGLIGYFFLILSFFYVLFCAFKQFISIMKRTKLPLKNHQICILAGFLIFLWPLGTSGNFFNNWLSIVYYLPVGFYLYFLKEVKEE